MPISVKTALVGGSDFLPRPPRESQEQAEFDYHVRLYTFGALKVLLRVHHLNIIETKGIYGLETALSNPMVRIMHILVEKLFSSMAQFILIKAIAEK